MMKMKLNFHLPSALCPACFKEPATKDTENTINNPAQQASHPPELRPANEKPRRHFPSPLQKFFAKERKSGASAPLSSEPIFSSLHLQQRFFEVEKQVTESLRKYLTKLGKDTTTIFLFNKIMKECVDHGIEALDQEITLFLENVASGESRQELESARSLAKARLRAAVEETSLSAGWKAFCPKESKLTWESPDGPLLIKRGFTLQQVKMEMEDIASGGFGSVSIFKNENGDKLIGKASKDRRRYSDGRIMDDLAEELKAYQTIYRAVGPHPNLVNVYGIAQVPKNNREMKRVLLMDMVPGSTGEKTFEALRKRWNAGRISSEQYWGAVQFIGRRMLDVTEHLGMANVVHNDIKPQNFLVNEETGEPVLIDFGVWTKSGEGQGNGTRKFVAPEAILGADVDERSDVFAVGVSLQDGIEEDRVKKLRDDLRELMNDQRYARLTSHGTKEGRVKELEGEIRKLAALHGIEGDRIDESDLQEGETLLRVRDSREGLYEKAAFKNAEGNMVRTPGTYSAETAYTRFMSSMLKGKKDDRVNSAQAKKLPFLSDSMLDDDAAKKVIKETIEWAKEEEQRASA